MSEKPGPTGEFPDGLIDASDMGEIRIGVGTLDGCVVIDFGDPYGWLGMPASHAVELANGILAKAKELMEKAN